MISISCQSVLVDRFNQLADQRVGVEQVVRQEQLGLVADLLEEEGHRLVEGVALGQKQQAVELLVLGAIELEFDDPVRGRGRGDRRQLACSRISGRPLPSGWLKTR